VVSPDGSGLTEVVPGSLAHAPEDPVWSAAGDSIYYRRSGGFVHAAAAVAAATPVRESPLVGGHDYPAASPLGAAFRVYLQNREELVVRRAADGRHLWLHHDPDGTDTRFSFRRTAGLYVDTVSVSPDTLDLSVSDQPTGTLAAAVRNNDGSPSGATVTWISRAPAVVTVDQAGLVTASDTTSVGVFVVATVGGWRSDSALVRVSP
jgi:hypothetical protein